VYYCATIFASVAINKVDDADIKAKEAELAEVTRTCADAAYLLSVHWQNISLRWRDSTPAGVDISKAIQVFNAYQAADQAVEKIRGALSELGA
jgi:hypothetical protein